MLPLMYKLDRDDRALTWHPTGPLRLMGNPPIPTARYLPGINALRTCIGVNADERPPANTGNIDYNNHRQKMVTFALPIRRLNG